MRKRAIILAGGKGTRLRPYTVVLPKPLMPVGEYPILEVVIRQLVNFEFEHITIAVNHQAELIKAFFGNGEKWNVYIDYSLEDQPLGTMGPLKLINELPEHFLVMNGDVLTDLNFADFFADHAQANKLFTISAHTREQKIDYGVLESDDKNRLIGFIEKPINTYNVSMGVYMLSRQILNYIPFNKPFGFDDLMIALLNNNEDVHIKPFKGYWLDIGRPDDYMQAIEEFGEMKNKFIKD
jgi:NDP-sugar pyrophosphorylase family protein